MTQMTQKPRTGSARAKRWRHRHWVIWVTHLAMTQMTQWPAGRAAVGLARMAVRMRPPARDPNDPTPCGRVLEAWRVRP